MYIVACIYCAICIILACDVYLPVLEVLKICNFGSTAIWAGQIGQSQAKPAAWEALRSIHGHRNKREYRVVYVWKEARMYSFATAPTMFSSSMSKSANID
jgi:late competence protein required for DNA uptake (superfamily II DNA/RNA helicase)